MANVSREKPWLFVFMIDQSWSMAESFNNTTAAEAVRDVVNEFIFQLVTLCTKWAEVRDYFYVSVIWYWVWSSVWFAFWWNLAWKDIIPMSELADNPLRMVQWNNATYPIRFEAVADERTPMNEAFWLTKDVVDKFIQHFPDSLQPIVLNITDGISTDWSPLATVQQIMNTSTTSWSTLVFNWHIDPSWWQSSVKFPSQISELPTWEENAEILFNCSSELTADMMDYANKTHNFNLTPWQKGYLYNAELIDLAMFIEIWTRTSSKDSWPSLPN